jgi:hypothetical protein
MEKAAVKEIRARKKKYKENRQAKWVAKLGSIVERTTRKIVEKHART